MRSSFVSGRNSAGVRNVRNTSVVANAASTDVLPRSKKAIRTPVQIRRAEQAIFDALATAKGRGRQGLSAEQQQQLANAIDILEADGGVEAPTLQPVISGRWRLLYTGGAGEQKGTASPIQRTFTGVEAFKIYQDVELEEAQPPRVNNVVEFGDFGVLKVEAEASTDSRPLPNFTPRRGAGLALFGKSSSTPPARPNSRIDFQFDQAAFRFSFLPFPIPYPVPFRILGNERKGWLDVTYMSSDARLRLSRGNKGTLFVLSKELSRETLLEQLDEATARGDDDEVLAIIPSLQRCNPTAAPAKSELASANWRLVWSQQSEDASALQRFGTKQAVVYQAIDAAAGTAQNLVKLGFATIQADAVCSAASDSRTNVEFSKLTFSLGPLKFERPLGRKPNASTPADGDFNDKPGFVDWLYLDEHIRITRGSKGSLFVHRREG